MNEIKKSRVIRQDKQTRAKFRVVLAVMQEFTDKSADQIADDIWQIGVNIKYNELVNQES